MTTPNSSPINPRLASLNAKKRALEETLATLLAERAALISQIDTSDAATPSTSTPTAHVDDDERTRLALASATATVKRHIATLHRYNEVKDIGQGLMGLVAEGRGTRVKDVMEDFGLDAGD